MGAVLLALALAGLPVVGPRGAPSSVVLSLPLTTNGALIPDDAGTVTHLVWNGTALVDSKGLAWTQNGTVPQVATGSPFTPDRAGGGPFSDAIYYAGTTTDALHFAGDFSLCVVFAWNSVPANPQTLLATGSGANNYGWQLTSTVAGAGYFGLNGNGQGSIQTAAGSVVGHNILCAGRTGLNGVVKLNLGSYANPGGGGSQAGGAGSLATLLGRLTGATGFSANAITIYEVWASTTTPSDALFTAIQGRVLGHYAGTKGEEITVTRSTVATYEANGKLWTAPAGVARITPSGLIQETTAATEYALNTGTHPKTNEATGSLPTGSYVAWIKGTGTLTLANGTATTTGLSCTTQDSTATCTFTVTVAGTMLVTTTSGTTLVQVVSGAARRNVINAAGTAVAQAADVATFTAPASATQRVWTVNGSRTSGAVTGGATVTLPNGTVSNVLACKRVGGRCQ